MTRPSVMRRKLSEDILGALLLAKHLHEAEVAERLLQALEVLTRGALDDKALSAAYMDIVATAPRQGLQ